MACATGGAGRRKMNAGVRLCVLSDTHGRLSQEAVGWCGGADYIVHAGDVGADAILAALESVAPLICVSGNVDAPGLAPLRARASLAGWRILVEHIVWHRGGPSPACRALFAEEGADLVIFGHTHRPFCEMVEGRVFFNPGSCGPRRFDLPRTVGEAVLDDSGGWFRILDLDQIRGAPPVVERRFPSPPS